jgi:hypothetical protein
LSGSERSPDSDVQTAVRALEHLAATQGEDGVAAAERALVAEGIGDGPEVWPGMKKISASARRNGSGRRRPTSTSRPGMRALSRRLPTMVQPVAFLISELPSTWSP